MSTQMTYKGYTSTLELDDDAGHFYGRVIGLRDVISFQGASVQELRDAFAEAVDDYLEWCAELGEPPEKPFSGKILLRLEPSLHRDVARQAQRQGSSVNAYIVGVLIEACATEKSSLAIAPTR